MKERDYIYVLDKGQVSEDGIYSKMREVSGGKIGGGRGVQDDKFYMFARKYNYSLKRKFKDFLYFYNISEVELGI